MLTRAEISTRLDVAVEAHRVSRDSARLVRGWMDSEGRIAAPNERCADLAREVLEAAGVEFRLAKTLDSPATPGETEETGLEKEAPDADRRESAGKDGPSKPSTRSAAARSRSAAAWAKRERARAGEMLVRNRDAVIELLAGDAASHGGELKALLTIPPPSIWEKAETWSGDGAVMRVRASAVLDRAGPFQSR